jgi:hypothetical protein
MAQATGTFSQYDVSNINEDLEQVLFNVDPYDCPAYTRLSKKKATNIRHEWLTESLRDAVTTNAVIEGDDATVNTSAGPTRVSNICQILDETVAVSGTHRSVDAAGYSDVLAHQLIKKGRELKRDIESTIWANQASVLGDDTTARKLGGIPSWIETNVARGTGGSSGGYVATTSLTAAATDSTAGDLRTFTETLLINATETAYVNGGDPSLMFMHPYQKRAFINSTNFPGVAELRSNVPQKGAKNVRVGNVEVYEGPFGRLEVVLDRFMRDREVFLIDPEYASIAKLRGMQTWDLAKIGDTDRKQMLTELTVVVENEKAHAVVSDLSTS